jgi:acetyl esterase/lipase
MITECDVEYGNRKNNQCDVYLPRRTCDKAPVVVVIHGGAWMFGNKSDMKEIAQFLVEKLQVVCVVPNYTLSHIDETVLQKILTVEILGLLLLVITAHKRFNVLRMLILFVSLFLIIHFILEYVFRGTDQDSETQHPVHVEDIAQCIYWTRLQEEKYQLNPNRILLLGHSSGAHLASLVTLNKRFLNALDVPVDDVIKGVIAISGPYSFWRLQESRVRHILNPSVFGHHQLDFTTLKEYEESLDALPLNGCEEKEEDCFRSWKEWSHIIDAWPIFHQHQIDSRTVPPFLIITAGIDLSLLYHADDFVTLLKKSGVFVERLHFDSTTHFSIRKHWHNQHSQVGKNVLSFFETILQTL